MPDDRVANRVLFCGPIEGSRDGKQWITLKDRTDTNDTMVNKTYGFTSDVLAGTSPVRYVRLTVRAAHLHNNANKWYPPTVYEVKVFGEPAGGKSPDRPSPADATKVLAP